MSISNGSIAIPFKAIDFHTPINTLRKFRAIKSESYGDEYTQLTWSSEPSSLGVDSLWVIYKEITEQQFKAGKNSTTDIGVFPGIEHISELRWEFGDYIDGRGNRYSKDVNLPGNLFLKYLTKSNGGRFFRIEEIGRWDKDIWMDISPGLALNVVEHVLALEEQPLERNLHVLESA
jgi:hypothetical protein